MIPEGQIDLAGFVVGWGQAIHRLGDTDFFMLASFLDPWRGHAGRWSNDWIAGVLGRAMTLKAELVEILTTNQIRLHCRRLPSVLRQPGRVRIRRSSNFRCCRNVAESVTRRWMPRSTKCDGARQQRNRQGGALRAARASGTRRTRCRRAPGASADGGGDCSRVRA